MAPGVLEQRSLAPHVGGIASVPPHGHDRRGCFAGRCSREVIPHEARVEATWAYSVRTAGQEVQRRLEVGSDEQGHSLATGCAARGGRQRQAEARGGQRLGEGRQREAAQPEEGDDLAEEAVRPDNRAGAGRGRASRAACDGDDVGPLTRRRAEEEEEEGE